MIVSYFVRKLLLRHLCDPQNYENNNNNNNEEIRNKHKKKAHR